MRLTQLRFRVSQWFFSRALKAYLFLKPIWLPFIIRFPRLHRTFFFMKEAVKSLLQPGPVAPPSELYTFPSPVAGNDVAPTGPEPDSRVPAWLLAEWKAVHQIDPLIFPEPALVASIPFYEVPYSHIAEPYLELCDLVGEGVTHVYLVPWLLKGGADLVTLSAVQAVTETMPDARVAVMATLDAKSTWKDRLPKGVRFIEFGRKYGFLSIDQREKLLTRLFLQLAPKVIHNINSELGYGIFTKYGAALAETSHLYASSFCGDRSPEGRMVGYPFGPLNDCFDHLTAVITDNQAHIDDMVRIYGMDREKFVLQYQPAPVVEKPKRFDEVALSKSTLDVLWAGRIDRQKRPDILIAIAEDCRDLPITFHVFGSSVLDGDIYTQRFAAMDNVVFHGPFDGLTSLSPDVFDVFLNTSQWDGLPNILLEAMSMGLPVISSGVGGIPELIKLEKTAFLVLPFDDILCYRKILLNIYEKRDLLPLVAQAAMDLVVNRHGWIDFVNLFKVIPYYSKKNAG